MDSEKYHKFNVSELTYKVVNDQDIKAYVLTPKDISAGVHPIVVKFHGGFFVTGASLYPEWYPQWALDYCLLHSAIIVTGDYRLLPESNATGMCEDVSDFWDWIRSDLQAFLDMTRPGIVANLSKVLVHGESAGGTLALQSGLFQPKNFIKAVIAMYPWTMFVENRTKPILGNPVIPLSVLENHLKNMVPGKIVTAAFPPERQEIGLSIAQQGSQKKFFGDEERMDMRKVLQEADHMPYTLILHGEEDSAVLVTGSIEWTEAAKKKFGDDSIELHIEPGGEHGFDGAITLSTRWLEDMLAKVTELWLGKTVD